MALLAESPYYNLWQEPFYPGNHRKLSTATKAPMSSPELIKTLLVLEKGRNTPSIQDLAGQLGAQEISRLDEANDPIWGLQQSDVLYAHQETFRDWSKGTHGTCIVASGFKHIEGQHLSGVEGCKSSGGDDSLLEDERRLEILCMQKGLAYPHWMGGELPSMDDLIFISQSCRKSKNLRTAKCLLLYVHSAGLESHLALGNHLVQMFVECESVSDAQLVFSKLAHLDEFSCTSLMQGYIECGHSYHALVIFWSMQGNGILPSRHTFMAVLKACTRLQDVEKGRGLHSQIIVDGFESDTCIANSVVVMYVKCGLLTEARDVFDEFLSWDAVSWNALIAGYAEHGFSEEALKILDKMQVEGIPSNAITSLGSLKACSNLQAISKGQEIHAEMVKKGHETDVFVSGSLVDTYTKCGLLEDALHVFDAMWVRGVVLWTALIAGYVEYGLGEEALSCLDEMRLEGVALNAVTYVFGLKASVKMQAINKGRELHIDIVKGAFENDPFVRNTLIDMYAKSGLVLEAQDVFDALPNQNVVTWNTLVSGYIDHGLSDEVLNCWDYMRQKGVLPNDKTYACILKACGILGSVKRGQEAHMEIIKQALDMQPLLGSSLLDMYANCVLLTEAQEVFNGLEIRDVVSWNSLIAGYSEHGHGKQALSCLQKMQLDGVFPDHVTFITSLKACSSIGDISRGFQLHTDCILGGFDSDSFVGNSLVDMYATCGFFAEAWKVLDDVPVISIIPWNALLAGYCEGELFEEVLVCAEKMQSQGLVPNAVTYVCILRACGSLNALEKGLLLHADIVKEETEEDPYIGSALVDMYAKFGLLADAQGVFDELRARDVVSWSALIAGYALWGLDEVARRCLQKMQSENVLPDVVAWNGVLSSYGEKGECKKASLIYVQMQEQGMLPDDVTFRSILRSCSSTTDMKAGQVIHAQVLGLSARGHEGNEEIFATSLIDMYGKCGSMVDAQRVLDAMCKRDLLSWTALVAGYARQGETNLVLPLFEKMEKEGVQPNEITFSKVLSACSHAGLVETGLICFDVMSRKHNITPSTEHHVCIIDLLARAGRLDEAVAMLEKMPSLPNFAIWTALLSACRKWGNLNIGQEVFECIVNEGHKEVASSLLMSKIFAEASLWEDVHKMEKF